MTLPAFRVHVPTSWDEAFARRAELDGAAALYMGGTDLLPRMRDGELTPRHLLDVKRLPGMRSLRVEGGAVEAGAAVTLGRITGCAVLPALGEVAAAIGNPRVRNAGTLGGSLAAAAPASDPATLLVALDARVTLIGPDGSRTLAVDDLLVGARVTALAPDEVLASVTIPLPAPGELVRFQRLALAHGPVVNAALVAGRGRCRVVVGAIAGRPRRVPEAEGLVADGGAGRAAAAGEAAGAAVEVLAGPELPERYLRRLVHVLVERLVRGDGRR